MSHQDPRILTIQDISGVGQCSLTVALPIISACGIETAILPSALLSTHTTSFPGYTFHDLTEQMPLIAQHWRDSAIDFSGLYTGYLGSERQIDYVIDIAQSLLRENSQLIVDPAMADHGELYPGFDDAFVRTMARLAFRADVMLPNITEAALMTGTDYREHYDRTYIDELLQRMREQGARTIVLTGVSYSPGTTGVVVFEGDKHEYYEHEKLEPSMNGTGDVFSSSFVGALEAGKPTFEAAQIAADFTVRCIRRTIQDPSHWYGPKFEPELGWLIQAIQS